MRSGWRAIGAAAAVGVASLVFLAAMVEFLAPDLAYAVKDRAAEIGLGNADRKFRITLGSTTGSSYLVGSVLNRHLAADAGYELEIASNASPGAVAALSDPDNPADLAIVDSASDAAVEADGVVGLAALETQYFSVIVPNDSPVRDIRDLAGAVNAGARNPGRPPTLGDRVLDYYGLVASGRVSVVRPTGRGNVEDFEAGHMTASTRTQSLHSDLIADMLRNGAYRLVPIADHEALASFLPGTRADFIPPGLYGPERRIPPEPVPTITTTQLLVARSDVPGRVVRDVLEALYDPSFAREVRYALDEPSGRDVGGLPLHPAAEIYYHRNDPVTSDLLGRLSFLGTVIAASFAGWQLLFRFRRHERLRGQRQLLTAKLATLQSLRHRIEDAPGEDAARALIREADELLCGAELDNAADRLDAEGIQSLRSVHRICWLAMEQRQGRTIEPARAAHTQPAPAHSPAPDASAADPA